MVGISYPNIPAAVTSAQTSKTISGAALADLAQATSSNMADGVASNILNHSNQENVSVTPDPEQRIAEEIAADHGRYLREMAGIVDDHEIQQVATKESTSKAKTKKRKPGADGPTTGSSAKSHKTSTTSDTDANAVERNDSLSPIASSKIGDFVESKEIRRNAKKAPNQNRAAPAKGSRLPDVATQNKPELSFIVASKVRRVQQYAAGINQALGLWLRNRYGQSDSAIGSDLQQPNANRVTVPEFAVLGTLTRMMLDYELAIPISLDTIRSIIIRETLDAPAFVAAERAGGMRKYDVRWITLDLDRACVVDDQVREKVAGCGFEVRSWFEVELEMYERQLWKSAVPSEMKETGDAAGLQGPSEDVQWCWRAET
ncbi:hypothetical protein Tdes44962_MAKER00353 [Teratosphaeria destructans]|uniref:Uncharacterized protein n=1 Tax=Teratosphaeria destructans TaxID=418781 RepID=A0A9W7SS79_9PEZI|nr:hypothetical protein Tdes44962_MAKER00353 [Teratosphaeria destructans]